MVRKIRCWAFGCGKIGLVTFPLRVAQVRMSTRGKLVANHRRIAGIFVRDVWGGLLTLRIPIYFGPHAVRGSVGDVEVFVSWLLLTLVVTILGWLVFIGWRWRGYV